MAQRVLAKIKGDLAQERVGLPLDTRALATLATLADEWLARRAHTHRSWKDDRGRWRNHLTQHFGHLRAPDMDHARIRAFVEAKLRDGMNPATVQLCVRLLSTFFSDLCERPRETGVTSNPVRGLPRSTRRLYKPRHDPRLTPFLERLTDVKRVFASLPEPISVAFAIGVLAGLRTGEILALQWPNVNLDAGRLIVRWQVQDGKLAPLKDDEPRILTIRKALVPILREWRLKTGGEGLLFPPLRPGRLSGPLRKPATFMRPHTLYAALRRALKASDLDERLTWYQCTRHSFASQYVLAGGSLEKLAAILGHSSTEVTRRYAHLRTELFAAEDAELIDVDLVLRGSATKVGQRMASSAVSKRSPNTQLPH